MDSLLQVSFAHFLNLLCGYLSWMELQHRALSAT